MKRTLIIIGIICLMVAGCTHLITGVGMNKKPGYANLELPGFFEADSTFKLSLGPTALAALKSLTAKTHPEYSEIASGVEGVRISIFNTDTDYKQLLTSIEQSINNAKTDGWQQVVSVREDSERVSIQVRRAGDRIKGLLVLVLDDREAVFLNIIGEFSEEKFVALGNKLKESKQFERQIATN